MGPGSYPSLAKPTQGFGSLLPMLGKSNRTLPEKEVVEGHTVVEYHRTKTRL